MKRINIAIAIILIMAACQKREATPYNCEINASATIDFTNLQTVVNVTSVFKQDEVGNDAPIGNAVLYMSTTQDMSEYDTMLITNYLFGSSCVFNVSNEKRTLNERYWYYIELQAPFSPAIRSDVMEMPIYSDVMPAKSFMLEDGSFVRFAPGNLQYQASSGTWRFAEHQYDTIGAENKNISSTYSGWIDLFGFGTSGSQYMPYSTDLNSSLYATSTISGTNDDWGVYCTISNGEGYSWRTPTSDNWVFIYSGRPNAAEKRSLATVNGVQGYILLPDCWTLPEGSSFTPDALTPETNTYTVTQWQALEDSGAVFLPETGHRVLTTVYGIDNGEGSYYSSSWDNGGTSSAGNPYNAQPIRFFFNNSGVYPSAIFTDEGIYNAYGSAVRLVRKVTN